jgi:hypothetical protein
LFFFVLLGSLMESCGVSGNWAPFLRISGTESLAHLRAGIELFLRTHARLFVKRSATEVVLGNTSVAASGADRNNTKDEEEDGDDSAAATQRKTARRDRKGAWRRALEALDGVE